MRSRPHRLRILLSGCPFSRLKSTSQPSVANDFHSSVDTSLTYINRRFIIYAMKSTHLNARGRLGRPVNADARSARTAQILDAAKRCFARKGFHATSMAEISEKAGVSPANLYQYFSNKDDLMMGLIQSNLEADLRIIQMMKDAGSLEEGLKAVSAWIGRASDGGQQHPIRLDILAETFRRADVADAARQTEIMMVDLLASLIEDGQIRGEVEAGINSHEVATLIVSLTDGILSHGAISIVPAEQRAAAFFKCVCKILGLPAEITRNVPTKTKNVNHRRKP